ncbi:hypothetical protein MNBD_NITROSPIRAE01-1929 [hydrothermal vent metagenome]|uniref:TNase-like domain-containing protein n=1 Tax=hydrothermal vent metagenome TaxID=652676 RepID=A0A3B1DF71_9ZZZZ
MYCASIKSIFVNIKFISNIYFLMIVFLFCWGEDLSHAGNLRVDRDCKDFVTQEQARAYFEHFGGSPGKNVDGLDNDRDGIPCESNPSLSNSPGRKDSRIEVLSSQFSGEVSRVIDGDTIVVSDASKKMTIRLSEIDCPEKDQSFGPEATQFTSDFVLGKMVTLKVSAVDKYGRRVAKVILSDGRDLNRALMIAGLAWWYERFSNDSSLGDLEAEARRKKIGLWKESRPIAPWVFRS